jgi:hypothetical protein
MSIAPRRQGNFRELLYYNVFFLVNTSLFSIFTSYRIISQLQIVPALNQGVNCMDHFIFQRRGHQRPHLRTVRKRSRQHDSMDR